MFRRIIRSNPFPKSATYVQDPRNGGTITGLNKNTLSEELSTQDLVFFKGIKIEDFEVAKILIDALAANKSIKTLRFMGALINNDAIEYLLEKLQENGCIKILDLSGLHLSETCMNHLNSLLTKKTCVLEDLILEKCSFGDSGAIAIANGLVVNTSLKEIKMRSCGIRAEGGMALADALRTNVQSKLIRLDLSDNDLGNQVSVSIMNAARNVALKNIDLSYTGVNIEGADIILEGLANNPKITNLSIVSQYPDLCGQPGNHVIRDEISSIMSLNEVLIRKYLHEFFLNYMCIALMLNQKLPQELTSIILKFTISLAKTHNVYISSVKKSDIDGEFQKKSSHVGQQGMFSGNQDATSTTKSEAIVLVLPARRLG